MGTDPESTPRRLPRDPRRSARTEDAVTGLLAVLGIWFVSLNGNAFRQLLPRRRGTDNDIPMPAATLEATTYLDEAA